MATKKKTKIWVLDRLSLNAGQKYCRMLQREHSAILSTFIKLPFAIKIFLLSIFEWPLKTDFTVQLKYFVTYSFIIAINERALTAKSRQCFRPDKTLLDKQNMHCSLTGVRHICTGTS